MPNVEALLKVVEVLEATPDEAVDLQSWTCGTTACAIGHAAQDPWFIERGFKLVNNTSPYYFDRKTIDHTWTWLAIERFFALETKQAASLFSFYSYKSSKDISSRQQVINRIREFVNEL
jgi:hypothetical protein